MLSERRVLHQHQNSQNYKSGHPHVPSLSFEPTRQRMSSWDRSLLANARLSSLLVDSKGRTLHPEPGGYMI